MSQTIFLSTVTSEFGEFRKRVATFLQRTKSVHVRFQDDFIHRGVLTLQMLEEEIRASHLVIHLVGGESGWIPPTEQVTDFLRRHPGFLYHFPFLADDVQSGSISATQWEFWLTRYFKIGPVSQSSRLLTFVIPSRLQAGSSQAAHFERLRSIGADHKQVVDADGLFEELVLSLMALESIPAVTPGADESVGPQTRHRFTLPEFRSGTQGIQLPLIDNCVLAAKEQESLCRQLDLACPTYEFAGMEFQLIPPGRCLIGAATIDRMAEPEEFPQTLVEIPKAILISRSPVQNSTLRQLIQQAAFHNMTHQQRRDLEELPDQMPVVGFSACDIDEICTSVSAFFGVDCRLPTEAEWEYAARAGSMSSFWWGNEFSSAKAILGCFQPSAPSPERANAWGITDPLGNVAEWTSSIFGPLNSPAPVTPVKSRPFATQFRTVRGGSFRDDSPTEIRLSSRRKMEAALRAEFVGFRFVIELPSQG